jgi:mannose-6-phosphate isomerase-like protein (cupin superfamily)
MQKVNIAAKLASFSEHYSPRIVGELNGQHVKVVKLLGEFVWHSHAAEDELFLVIRGALRMDYRDEAGVEQRILLGPGELLIVPRGVEHKPFAADEVEVMLFEPAGTVNTGEVECQLTRRDLPRL